MQEPSRLLHIFLDNADPPKKQEICRVAECSYIRTIFVNGHGLRCIKIASVYKRSESLEGPAFSDSTFGEKPRTR